LTNGETDGRPFQRFGRGGGKRARFQRHNDQENSEVPRQKTITKHVGASHNSGARRDPEECVFAQIESDDREISNILKNLYSIIDKAVKKGVLHKNTAARKKSRVGKIYFKIQS
jgi:ribosomal protein S20